MISHFWPSPARSNPSLPSRYGQVQGILGEGRSGQAFDLGGDRVLKVTDTKAEVDAVRLVLRLRKQGHALNGFIRYRAQPERLGSKWVVQTERVDPVDQGRGLGLVLRVSTPKTRFLNFLLGPDPEDLGTPFEFASEASQDWVDAPVGQRSAYLAEYKHYVGVIQELPGFREIGASMAEFTSLTGKPLFDIRPENCGRIRQGDRHIVCFDVSLPERGKNPGSLPRPVWR